jgi:hypothetical protein
VDARAPEQSLIHAATRYRHGARARLALAAGLLSARYLPITAMNENFSLVVMCLFLLGSLAFLAQQLTSYH